MMVIKRKRRIVIGVVILAFIFLGSAYRAWSEGVNIPQLATVNNLKLDIQLSRAQPANNERKTSNLEIEIIEETITINEQNIYPGYEGVISFLIENQGHVDGYLSVHDVVDHMPEEMYYAFEAALVTETDMQLIYKSERSYEALTDVLGGLNGFIIQAGEIIQLNLFIVYGEHNRETQMRENSQYSSVFTFKMNQNVE